VTDDLQEALRKALHDHRHILTAVHEKKQGQRRGHGDPAHACGLPEGGVQLQEAEIVVEAPRSVQLQEAETVLEAPTVLLCLPHAHLPGGRAWLRQPLVPIGEAAGTSAVVVVQQLAVAG